MVDIQLRGFFETSKFSYVGVVYYLRAMDSKDGVYVHVSLVMARRKVAPVKRLSILYLELSTIFILSDSLGHVANTLAIYPTTSTCTWTDSHIHVVSGWLLGIRRNSSLLYETESSKF